MEATENPVVYPIPKLNFMVEEEAQRMGRSSCSIRYVQLKQVEAFAVCLGGAVPEILRGTVTGKRHLKECLLQGEKRKSDLTVHQENG